MEEFECSGDGWIDFVNKTWTPDKRSAWPGNDQKVVDIVGVRFRSSYRARERRIIPYLSKAWKKKAMAGMIVRATNKNQTYNLYTSIASHSNWWKHSISTTIAR